MTSTWFHRWLQRHGLYGLTTHSPNTANGRGQEAVSMKPEEMITQQGQGATYWAWPYPIASDPGTSKTHRNTGFGTVPCSDPKGSKLYISSLSYVCAEFWGLSSTPCTSSMGTISAHLCCELCKSSFARNQEDAIHSFIQVLKTIPMAPSGNTAHRIAGTSSCLQCLKTGMGTGSAEQATGLTVWGY